MNAVATFTYSKRFAVLACGRTSNNAYHMNRAAELARRLRKRGHRAQVVCLRGAK